MSDTLKAAVDTGDTACCDKTSCCGGAHTLEVFDPPMCCSSGVCGPEPDSSLTTFAADLNWLKGQGVQVRRYNLAQEPAHFTANPRVKQVVDALGVEGLPIVVIDGRMVSQGEYPSRAQLREMTNLVGPSAPQRIPVHQVPEATQMDGCCGGGDTNNCC